MRPHFVDSKSKGRQRNRRGLKKRRRPRGRLKKKRLSGLPKNRQGYWLRKWLRLPWSPFCDSILSMTRRRIS